MSVWYLKLYTELNCTRFLDFTSWQIHIHWKNVWISNNCTSKSINVLMIEHWKYTEWKEGFLSPLILIWTPIMRLMDVIVNFFTGFRAAWWVFFYFSKLIEPPVNCFVIWSNLSFISLSNAMLNTLTTDFHLSNQIVHGQHRNGRLGTGGVSLQIYANIKVMMHFVFYIQQNCFE